jgi:hypothetical protein
VVEAQAAPGGKMRCLPSPAGPVDAGPTVLTLRGVFDDLFASVGERLSDHVTLVAEIPWRGTGGRMAARSTSSPTRGQCRSDPRLCRPAGRGRVPRLPPARRVCSTPSTRR